MLLLLFIHTILEFVSESDFPSLALLFSLLSLSIELDSISSSSSSSSSCATAIGSVTGSLIGNPILAVNPLIFTLILLHLTFFILTLLLLSFLDLSWSLSYFPY